MTLFSGCPGARTIREATPQYEECPHCGGEVEVWSDEPFARCPHCRGLVRQKRGASCLDWCAYAAQCVGLEKLQRLKGTTPHE